jgi:hypothetical protein
MVCRNYVVGFAVVLSLGTVLISSESFGRSGAGGGSSTSGFHGSKSSGHHQSAMRSSLNRRRAVWGLSPYATRFYSTGTYAEPPGITNDNSPNQSSSVHIHSAPEPAIFPINGHPIFVYHPGCSSQTVTVPWNDSKQRSVNIVRC